MGELFIVSQLQLPQLQVSQNYYFKKRGKCNSRNSLLLGPDEHLNSTVLVATQQAPRPPSPPRGTGPYSLHFLGFNAAWALATAAISHVKLFELFVALDSEAPKLLKSQDIRALTSWKLLSECCQDAPSLPRQPFTELARHALLLVELGREGPQNTAPQPRAFSGTSPAMTVRLQG